MMALKKIPILKSFQARIGELFCLLPFSANQLTVSAVLFAAAGFCFAALYLPFHSLLFFMLAGAIDAIDGAVARAKRQVSPRGAYIDGITDRLVEFLFIMSFFFYFLPPFILPAQLILIFILFFGSAMSSFATAYAEHRHVASQKKIAGAPGIFPRAERLLALFLALALYPFNPLASSGVLFAGALLSIITFFQRFFYFAA